MDRSGMSLTVWGRRRWGVVGPKARRMRWPAVMAALFLPLAIGRSLPAAAGPAWWALLVATGIVACAGVCHGVRRGREGPGAAVRGIGLPLVTMGFIAAGALMYWTLPDTALNRLCGLNLDEAGLPDLIRVTLARSLLQGSVGHLLTNAILLGFLGFRLEPGLGPGRTLAVLALGSCLASLIGLNFLLSQVDVFPGGARMLCYPPAGGTGAAAAFLGLGAVRWEQCPPERAATGAVPLFSGRMGVLTPLLTGLLLLGTISGHTAPVTGLDGMAGYWGLAGGWLGGLVTAGVMQTWGDPETCRPPAVSAPSHGGAPRPCDLADGSFLMH